MAYSTRLDEAFVWAATLHRAQVRKGTGVPYLTHLMGVASLVGEHGGSEDQVIAALLHDAMEDQEVTADDITARFGPVVSAMVFHLSDAVTAVKPPWEARKRAYLEVLRLASPEVRLISAADKLHNVRAMVRDLRAVGPSLWQHFRGTPAQTAWYYRAMWECLGEGWSHPILDDLAEATCQLEALVAAESR